jgi:hypothetical protein
MYQDHYKRTDLHKPKHLNVFVPWQRTQAVLKQVCVFVFIMHSAMAVCPELTCTTPVIMVIVRSQLPKSRMGGVK